MFSPSIPADQPSTRIQENRTGPRRSAQANDLTGVSRQSRNGDILRQCRSWDALQVGNYFRHRQSDGKGSAVQRIPNRNESIWLKHKHVHEDRKGLNCRQRGHPHRGLKKVREVWLAPLVRSEQHGLSGTIWTDLSD